MNLVSPQAYVSLKHEGDKVIVFERAGLVFAFNFHPTNSFADYRIGVDDAGTYKPVLTTDEKRFEGQDRIDFNARHHTTPLGWNNRANWMHVSPVLSSVTNALRLTRPERIDLPSVAHCRGFRKRVNSNSLYYVLDSVFVDAFVYNFNIQFKQSLVHYR